MNEIKKFFELNGKKCIIFDVNIDHIKITENDKKVIKDGCIPFEAAPFLKFFEPDKGGLLPFNEYFKTEYKEFDDKYVLGMNGEGNSILIYKEGVVLFNQDCEEFVFVNSSLESFLRCIIVYKEKINEIVGRYDTFVDVNEVASEDDVNDMRMRMKKVDSKCTEEDTFWTEELSNFIEE